MNNKELNTLLKAHQLLDNLTDNACIDAKLKPRLNEAFDGLSQLIYYMENHYSQQPSWWQKAWRKFKQLYFRHVVGVSNF